jgi:hypothetical protein
MTTNRREAGDDPGAQVLRPLKRAALALAAVVGPLLAAAPAHAIYYDNHNQALVEDRG